MKQKFKVDTEEIKSEKGTNIKLNQERYEYSHMGAKKVPMAEKRTYPGSELT